jgi:hypothetical protein
MHTRFEYEPVGSPDRYRATAGSRQWDVRVSQTPAGSLAESCGGVPVDVHTWHVDIDDLT